MVSRTLLSSVHDHQIPQSVKNALKWAQAQSNQLNQPFLAKPLSFLATNVIKSYFEKGQVREAQILFDEMPTKDVVTWTAMISGYTSCNLHKRAWEVFREMITDSRGAVPNEYTFSSALKACKGMESHFCGLLVHGLVIKYPMRGCIYVENVLLDMYATCSSTMDEASMLFEEISNKNDVSWTTLIAGYTHKNDGYGALRVFRQMLMEEAKLNPFCTSIIVRACASIGSYGYGKQMHAAVVKYGFESNITVMNSILDMYCRCSFLSDAEECFHGMTEKNSITWNTLIAGYEKSDSHKSLIMYSRMESEGYSSNCFTFTSILAAVSNLAVLSFGEQIHGRIIQRGLGGDVEMDNALIDMYAKCGNIINSRKIFDQMPWKNLLSWTSMMIGYGSHGYGKEAVELFDEMVKSGTRPDYIVFMAVLSACSHAGLVEEGLRYFRSMIGDYNIKLEQGVYGCVVDLLGRAGKVEEAYELIKSMPFPADETVWGVFLGACKMHKHPNLGKLAVSRVLELKPSIVGTYVTLSNLYAADGNWGEFAAARKLMRRMGNKKETGRSWVELQNQMYCFVAGDKMGSHIEWVYQVLEELVQHMKDLGHGSDLDDFLHGFEEYS
ncbi:OLC1v1002097C1 [Oldenlandia corymbosa var. corymbosa]|uniref:OLC1v1002097C1 n=1 Tax=Oldenlandia corymbosa var. corymbosa TaxID=529605 RepID=A0AAV1D9B7_OLDCO|nr:OLC1v1002097C1 [Oldenlandia corymbosa var. corymbosa]